MVIQFRLLGAPQGKGRARSRLFKKKDGSHFISNYTPESTRSYEAMMRDAAAQAMNGRPPIADPVRVYIRAIFDVPASWSKKKRAAALAGAIWPGKKPDMDNIVKGCHDAMNAVVFKDDALIVWEQNTKRYGEIPEVSVEVCLA